MSSPGGPPHNGDENRQGGILATTFIVTVIASIAVALRMWVRLAIVKKVGWDDYTIIAATLGIIIGCGLVVVQVHYGLGRHKFYLTTWQFIEFQKYSYGEWIQTFQTLMFTKVSICFFLLRIPVDTRLIRPIQWTIVALILSNVVLTVIWIVQCRPIHAAWNTLIQGQCFTKGQLQRIIISQAIISIISDFLLATLPIFILWKVQISTRVKAGLCTLMSLGVLTATCCIVRTILNWQNVNSDPSWESIDNWYWRSWEVCIGITAASVPALRPGYKHLTSTISSYRSARSSRKSSKTLVNGHDNHHGTRAPAISSLKDTNRVDLAYAIPHLKRPDPVLGSTMSNSKKHRPLISSSAAGDGYPMDQWQQQQQHDEGAIQKTTTFDLESQTGGSSASGRGRSAERDGSWRDGENGGLRTLEML
ncbi:MAG: hypothetical protein Q9191_004849 [Dirinaria sp. TL-2023a]